MPRCRNRTLYGLILAAVILTGLLSRSSFAVAWPDFLATYAGDTLWALAVFLVLGFAFPSASSAHLALATLAISFGVEASQLYQAQWLDQIRNTQLGHLLLGNGFKWSDLLCYTVGALIGFAAEALQSRLAKGQSPAGPTGRPS